MDMKKIIDMMIKDDQNLKQEFSDQLSQMVQQKVFGDDQTDVASTDDRADNKAQ